MYDFGLLGSEMKGNRSSERRWISTNGLIALFVVAGMFCAQASHLFHTHDLNNGTSTCIACSHEQTASLAPVVALCANPAVVAAPTAEPRTVVPSVVLAPLTVAPKTSPPVSC
jgi:hypothetical protein